MRENSPEVLPDFPTHIIPKVKKPKPRDISPVLRGAARHIERYGFTPLFGNPRAPACFLGSIESAIESTVHKSMLEVRRDHDMGVGSFLPEWNRLCQERARVHNFLAKTLFGGEGWFVGISYLREHGWNKRDAVAALNIAADIAECEGR